MGSSKGRRQDARITRRPRDSARSSSRRHEAAVRGQRSLLSLILVVFALACAPSAPSRSLPAGLVAEGFEALPNQARVEVAEALASLPPEHLSTVALLRFDPTQQQSGRSLRRERLVSLGYRLWTEQLQMEHRMSGVTALEETLVHEIGHQVAFAEGARLERRFNARFWPAGRQLHARPVENAGTDSIEDFAVTYSQYRYNADYLAPCCPERAAFMRDEVFAGRSWPPAAASAPARGLRPYQPGQPAHSPP